MLIGGGIAALWTLARLRAKGFRAALVEPARLGQGQTLASQGIIHGGLKYTLSGLFNARAEAIAQMPSRWRQSLEGNPIAGDPDLSKSTTLSPCCFLWRSSGIAAALGMIGARAGLQTTPVLLNEAETPLLLQSAIGGVYRVDEPVIDTSSVLRTLRDSCADSMIAADGVDAIAWSDGRMRVRTMGGSRIEFSHVKQIIVAAGTASNAVLTQLGCDGSEALFVRRPLHMSVVRSHGSSAPLLPFFGHCVDGKETRVTITSAIENNARVVWQVGGRLAEAGVAMQEMELRTRLKNELREVLPLLDQDALEFSSYRVDRMEFAQRARQEDAAVLRINPAISVALPLKLALAPLLAERVEAELRAVGIVPSATSAQAAMHTGTPQLGAYPWEHLAWTR